MAMKIPAQEIVRIITGVIGKSSAYVPIVMPDPVSPVPDLPSLTNTYANSTVIYANNSNFYLALLSVQQRIAALNVDGSANNINFGSGSDTTTGDALSVALTKLQTRIALAERALAATQDNTLSGETTLSSGLPVWASRFQSIENRFTAIGVA